MLKNYAMLSLGLALMVTAFRVDAGLREVKPDEAELVKGAVCPYEGLNPGWVCHGGSSDGNCWWGGTQPCGVNSCKVVCRITKQQAATAGCSYGSPICTTVQCVAASSVTANCPARFWNQETCNSAWGCYCGSPTVRVNCPVNVTYTKWNSCP